MGFIDDVQSSDAIAFTDADLMPGVESATYKPHGGSSRTVKGVVTRTTYTDSQGRVRPMILLAVQNNSTGIAVASLDERDKVSISYIKGGTAADYGVMKQPESQAAGLVTYRLV